MSNKILTIAFAIVVATSFMSANLAKAQRLKDAVGIWFFDEGEKVVASDSSGKDNHGELKKGPVWKKGRFGKTALEFDGIDDYVVIDNKDSEFDFIHADFTMCFWVNLKNDTQQQTVLDTESPGWEGWNIRYNMFGSGCRKTFCFGGGGAERAALVTVPPLNQWHHVAITYSEKTRGLKGYLNGVLDKETGINLDLTPGVHDILLIGTQGTRARYRNGKFILDDVGIFNVVLTELYFRRFLGRFLTE